MAETQRSMSSNDAGNATDSSSKARRARGASDVPAVNLKINQADLFNDLDALIGAGRVQQGCSVGLMVSKLDEPLRNKLNEIFCNTKVDSSSLKTLMDSYGLAVSSSDVLRRHRRRLIGKDGCKCPIENSAVSPK
jgi:hypothetical protein